MLPFFYAAQMPAGGMITLDEDNSRHIVQVLRMKKDARLRLTDGNGNLFTAVIVNDHKKSATVRIVEEERAPEHIKKVTIAISLVKNNSRFEWFLEKAAELGISHIIPVICERTERQHFRHDRMQNILVSAMLQSQQAWLTQLSEPVEYPKVLELLSSSCRMIAHCMEDRRHDLQSQLTHASDRSILIGPEGDFTRKEVQQALEKSFIPVSLGETRLRTETAGIVAATLMKLL